VPKKEENVPVLSRARGRLGTLVGEDRVMVMEDQPVDPVSPHGVRVVHDERPVKKPPPWWREQNDDRLGRRFLRREPGIIFIHHQVWINKIHIVLKK